MNRNELKGFINRMNDIYYSIDWIPEGKVSYETFNEEHRMPDNLKDKLDTLIGEISA